MRDVFIENIMENNVHSFKLFCTKINLAEVKQDTTE